MGSDCISSWSLLIFLLFTRFIVDSTIAVYRNSVYKTRNIFVQCGNVRNTLILQLINAADCSIILINPFYYYYYYYYYSFPPFILARTLSAASVASVYQIKSVLWNYLTTVTCELEHDKNNIITHAPSTVYFSSVRCSRKNALGIWLPIISTQLEFSSD